MHDAITRRAFLAGSAAAVALAACSSGGTKKSDLTMVTFSDPSALRPAQPARLTMGFADSQGAILTQPPQPQLTFTVTSNGTPIGQPLSVPAHTEGIPKAYFPVVFTPPQPGIYTIATNAGGSTQTRDIQITATTDVVGVGQMMIPFDTPTVSDPRGVELLCTRTPPCPLHDVTLREALAGGTPVAFLVATPQFCQTAICGPVLDVLLAEKDRFPNIKMLHSEVYPTVAAAQPSVGQVVPVVDAYHLTFEPALYLAKPDGTIANRIDTIFDGVELRAALTDLTR